MSFYQDIGLYLKTLKFFGILCFSYDHKRDFLYVTSKDNLYAKIIFCVIQFLSFGVLIFYITNYRYFMLDIYNHTGNIYAGFEFCFMCLFISFIYAYFYINQNQQMQTVEKLIQLSQNKKISKKLMKNLKWLFGFYIFCSILSFQNFSTSFWRLGLRFWTLVVYSVLLSFNFILCGLIIVWYTCMKGALKYLFQCCNEDFENLLSDINQRNIHIKIRRILICYYSLLSICKKINSSYGYLVFIISVHVVSSSPTGIFFLISVVLDNESISFLDKLRMTLSSILWNLPLLILFIVMFCAYRIESEANKTFKILCRIPRKVTSIERMVQKFLLKNLGEKPLLTAYGFFSLNKNSLFIFFAVILRYMVILVQFKEMENPRKQLSNVF